MSDDEETQATIMKKRRDASRLEQWGPERLDSGYRVSRGGFELCGPSGRPIRFRTFAGAANRAMKLNREAKGREHVQR